MGREIRVGKKCSFNGVTNDGRLWRTCVGKRGSESVGSAGSRTGTLTRDFRIKMTAALAAVNATSRRGNPSKATPRDRPARNWA